MFPIKRLSLLIATVCVACSGFAQGNIAISGRLFPSLLQSEDEAIRDLALRKRVPSLAVESHPYFRGNTTESDMGFFPGSRVFPVFTVELIQAFPVIAPVQPGFRTFPLLEIEIEAIFTRAPLPTFQFDDLFNRRTSLEHIASDLTVPGGRRLPTHSENSDSVIGEFGALPVTTVPEPGTCALLGLASLTGWFIHRRRR